MWTLLFSLYLFPLPKIYIIRRSNILFSPKNCFYDSKITNPPFSPSCQRLWGAVQLRTLALIGEGEGFELWSDETFSYRVEKTRD